MSAQTRSALEIAATSEIKNLTLRDLFAAIALHGIVSGMSDNERNYTDWSFEAADAYAVADAMLQRKVEQ